MGGVEGRALSQTPDLACPSCPPPLPRAGRGIRVPQIAGWGLGRLQSPRLGGGEGQMPLPLLPSHGWVIHLGAWSRQLWV